MLSHVDFICGWEQGWSAAAPNSLSVTVGLPSDSAGAGTAWLVFEGREVSGQVTVWDVGRCELEAYQNDDSSAVLLESRTVSTMDELSSAIRAVLEVCR